MGPCKRLSGALATVLLPCVCRNLNSIAAIPDGEQAALIFGTRITVTAVYRVAKRSLTVCGLTWLKLVWSGLRPRSGSLTPTCPLPHWHDLPSRTPWSTDFSQRESAFPVLGVHIPQSESRNQGESDHLVRRNDFD
jgi:hypothetical protein